MNEYESNDLNSSNEEKVENKEGSSEKQDIKKTIEKLIVQPNLEDDSFVSNSQPKRKNFKPVIIISIFLIVVASASYFAYQYYYTQSEIKTIQALIDKAQYSAAIERSEKFLKSRKNKKIEKLLAKANEELEIKNKIDEIKELMKNKKYYAVIEKCNEFLKVRKNAEVEQILNEAIKEAKDIYVLSAKVYYLAVLSCGALLEDIRNKIVMNWHSFIYDSFTPYNSIDDAVTQALEQKAKEVSDAKNYKESIDKFYAMLKEIPFEDPKLSEMCTAIKEVYDSFYDFYQLVLYPSGNYVSFSTETSTKNNLLAKKLNELNILLERENIKNENEDNSSISGSLWAVSLKFYQQN